MASDYSDFLSMFDSSEKPRKGRREHLALICDESDGTYAIMVVTDEVGRYMEADDPDGAVENGAVRVLGYLMDEGSAMEFVGILECIANGGAEISFGEG